MKSIDRILDVLEHVVSSGGVVVTPHDASAALDVNVSTCSRILKGLARRGYVEQKNNRHGYSPGPALTTRVGIGSHYQRVAEIAERPMIELAEKNGNRVILAAYSPTGKHILRSFSAEVGKKTGLGAVYHDFYHTCTGRVLLAWLTPPKLREFVEVNGLPGAQWPRIHQFADLERELELIRAKGFVAFPITSPPLWVIACPIVIGDGPVLAIGTTAETEKMAEQVREDLQSTVSIIRSLFQENENYPAV